MLDGLGFLPRSKLSGDQAYDLGGGVESLRIACSHGGLPRDAVEDWEKRRKAAIPGDVLVPTRVLEMSMMFQEEHSLRGLRRSFAAQVIGTRRRGDVQPCSRGGLQVHLSLEQSFPCRVSTGSACAPWTARLRAMLCMSLLGCRVDVVTSPRGCWRDRSVRHPLTGTYLLTLAPSRSVSKKYLKKSLELVS